MDGARLSCLPRTRGVFIATTSGHSFPSICCINGNQRRKHNIYISGVYNYVELVYSKFSCLSQRSWSSNITRVTILVQILKYTTRWYDMHLFLFAFNFGYSLFGMFFSSSLPPHNLEPVGPHICTKHLTSIAGAPWLFSRHWQRKGPRKNRNWKHSWGTGRDAVCPLKWGFFFKTQHIRCSWSSECIARLVFGHLSLYHSSCHRKKPWIEQCSEDPYYVPFYWLFNRHPDCSYVKTPAYSKHNRPTPGTPWNSWKGHIAMIHHQESVELPRPSWIETKLLHLKKGPFCLVSKHGPLVV